MIYNESKFNSEWETLPLNKLGEFKRGKSKHRPRNDIKLFRDGKYPLVQTGEIKAANLYINSHNATYNEVGLKQSKLWDAGTLCITIAANIAETGILAYPMCFPDSCVGFTADKEMTSELFMHYVFTYIRKSIQTSSLGSIQDNINIELLTALNFKIPKKNIQDKIVELLATIDNKIELNNNINTELEAMAKTIYNYWFVQFDFPFDFAQGKPHLKGCHTELAEVKPYKTSGGEMEYNEELKREIPKGWKGIKIGEYAEVKKGDLITAKDSVEGSVKVVAAGIDFSYTHSEHNREKNTITISGSGANAGFINFWREPIFASDCITVRGKTDTETLLLLYYLKFLQTHILNKATGSAQPHVYPDDIKNLNYVVPDSSTIDKFRKVVIPLNNQIANNLKQNQELITLRDFLLPLLMNGQVKVV